MSSIRQNYHSNSEATLNKQINMELYASYVYMSMASYFGRDDVALHGFSKRFHENSEEERSHALKLIKYQNKRGGRVVYNPIDKPSRQEWDSILDAVQDTLELEKFVNQSLLDLHKIADEHGDAHLMNFLEEEFLEEQVESIKEIGDLITKMKRAGTGLGVHVIDKELS